MTQENDPAVVTSPLKEVEVESIDILFNEDPEGFSDKQIEKAVEVFRRMRLTWEAEEASGEKTRTSSAGKKPKGPREELSLKDLGLE